MDRSRRNDQPIELEGRTVRLRDWHKKDLASLRSQLDPARPWHDTNGPYFGRMTPGEADAMAARLATLAAQDPASLPHPRDSLAIAELDTDHLLGQASWYWECEQTDWRRLGLVIYDERSGATATAPTPCASGPVTYSPPPTPCAWTRHLLRKPAMIAVGRRLGFTEEGRFRQARRWPGGIHDSVVLGVLRGEWQHQHPSQPARPQKPPAQQAPPPVTPVPKPPTRSAPGRPRFP